jgi:hypothetical protein
MPLRSLPTSCKQEHLLPQHTPSLNQGEQSRKSCELQAPPPASELLMAELCTSPSFHFAATIGSQHFAEPNLFSFTQNISHNSDVSDNTTTLF